MRAAAVEANCYYKYRRDSKLKAAGLVPLVGSSSTSPFVRLLWDNKSSASRFADRVSVTTSFNNHPIVLPAPATAANYCFNLQLPQRTAANCRELRQSTAASAPSVAFGWPFCHQRCNTPGPRLPHTAAGATKSSATEHSCSSSTPTTISCWTACAFLRRTATQCRRL